MSRLPSDLTPDQYAARFRRSKTVRYLIPTLFILSAYVAGVKVQNWMIARSRRDAIDEVTKILDREEREEAEAARAAAAAASSTSAESPNR
jgi:hypothetical protein